jgi:tetratricopeptide (TPR) repeat protein
LLHRSSYWVVTAVCLLSLWATLAWPAVPSLPLHTVESGMKHTEFAAMIRASALANEHQQMIEYELAVEQAPTNIIALYNLAMTQYQLALKSQDKALMTLAEQNLARVLSLNPDILALYFKLGKLALLQNNLTQAENWYRQGLDVAPDNASLTFNLAEVLEQQNRLSDAQAAYKKALSLDPQFIYAYNNLGLLYERVNATEQAEDCYLKALAVNPAYVHARLNLGALYDGAGKRDEAKNQFELVLQIDPGNGWANFYLGGQAYRNGQYEQAVNYLQTASRSGTGASAAYYFLTLALVKLNRLDEAVTASMMYLEADQTGPYAKEMQAFVNTNPVRNVSRSVNGSTTP